MSSAGAQQASVAWIGDPRQGPGAGQWGTPGELSLPLDDRGLLLADGLFETVLVEQGKPRLLEAHLERWHRSAALLEMAPPPGAGAIRDLLKATLERCRPHSAALRLNWSRGASMGRGLDLPHDPEAATAAGGGPRFWLQLSPVTPSFDPLRVIVSRHERRNADSRLSHCKTFAYGPSIAARREAQRAGADDALLLSTAGGLCCGTTANLLLRHGARWLTPPLASGCLPGIMRGQALAVGLAKEEALDQKDLLEATGVLLINSLGCRPVGRFQGQELSPMAAGEAERLWRSLLEAIRP